MRRPCLVALCALAAFAATPAWACLGPYAHHLLSDAPDNAPAGTAVIRVSFTNQGAEFLDWEGRMPMRMGEYRWLVGIARRIDGPAGDFFPVYARPSSCMPDFFGSPPQPLNRQTFLVGRFEQLSGQRVFVALARATPGRWERFDLD